MRGFQYGALLAACFASPALFGAVLLSAHLSTDVSEKPPGDQIDLHLILEPNEEFVIIEARALTIVHRGADQSWAVGVRAADKKFSDENGYHVVSMRIERDANIEKDIPCPVIQKLVIPYASLKLKAGEKKSIGYEVRANRKNPSKQIAARAITNHPLDPVKCSRQSFFVDPLRRKAMRNIKDKSIPSSWLEGMPATSKYDLIDIVGEIDLAVE